MTISYVPLRKDNRAGVDKLLDWLRIHLAVLLCGGFLLGVSLEEAGRAMKMIVSAKHQKVVQEQPPNGYVAALPASSEVVGHQNSNNVEAAPALALQDAPPVVPVAEHYQMAVYYPNGIRLKTFVSR